MKYEKSKRLFAVVALLFLMGLGTPSAGWAEYKILHNFEGPPNDGRNPRSSLVQDSTYFYGVTEKGGSTDTYCGPDGCGVIFKVKKDGSDYTILHSFRDGTVLNDGVYPVGSLTLSGSTLYGTTSGGGNGVEQALETIFKINTDGSDYAILHTFGG